MRNILEEKTSNLGISKPTTNLLIENRIDSVYKLCNYSRTNLLQLGCKNSQVNEISIKLQLLGLDLKRNYAKRNTLVDQLSKNTIT